MFENEPDVLKPNDVCRLIGIGKNKFYVLVHSGELKAKFIGKTILVTKISLIEFLNN